MRLSLAKIVNRFSRPRQHGAGLSRLGPTGEDWQIGDIAECVIVGPWHCLAPSCRGDHSGPAFGELHVVHVVVPVHAGDVHRLCLGLAPWQPRIFSSAAFRKITPRADAAERADQAFIDELTAPARQLEHV